jgi:hypothetical protein
MKFIASKDFNQGASNPLRIPGGEIHIKMGTTFSIGDDFTPVEELEGEDLQTYRTFHRAGCLCPFDSIRGQQIWAEVVRLQAVEVELSDEAQAGNPWWKQPVWITILAVSGVVIVVVIATIVARHML